LYGRIGKGRAGSQIGPPPPELTEGKLTIMKRPRRRVLDSRRGRL
jgi:hypothetical protein